ncbi:conjugal transfer protein TraE [Sesbania bispinosa]|nr:conjugal transfer protein TraE [Sesbania bispinosa]
MEMEYKTLAEETWRRVESLPPKRIPSFRSLFSFYIASKSLEKAMCTLKRTTGALERAFSDKVAHFRQQRGIQQGLVRSSTQKVRLSAPSESGMLQLATSDNGCA